MTSKSGYPMVIAACIRPGYQVAYPVMVDGKEILSRGEVFGFRRVAHDKAEVTLLHAKTGSLFTNVIAATQPVQLTSMMFDPDADALARLMASQLKAAMKGQASDFYTLMPVED